MYINTLHTLVALSNTSISYATPTIINRNILMVNCKYQMPDFKIGKECVESLDGNTPKIAKKGFTIKIVPRRTIFCLKMRDQNRLQLLSSKDFCLSTKLSTYQKMIDAIIKKPYSKIFVLQSFYLIVRNFFPKVLIIFSERNPEEII